jgi:deazaflavin-dependent oxidoreductase (nitroreductase family)
MPSDVQLKVMNALHKTVLTLSFGKIGGNLLGMPAFELITTGRKSGRRRSVMLTSPYQEGDTVAIVASKGGDDEHPAWFLNLRDDPAVEVRYPGQDARPMTARIADAEERARLWPLITEDHDNYAGYQKKTDREIPVVLLEPRS